MISLLHGAFQPFDAFALFFWFAGRSEVDCVLGLCPGIASFRGLLQPQDGGGPVLRDPVTVMQAYRQIALRDGVAVMSPAIERIEITALWSSLNHFAFSNDDPGQCIDTGACGKQRIAVTVHSVEPDALTFPSPIGEGRFQVRRADRDPPMLFAGWRISPEPVIGPRLARTRWAQSTLQALISSGVGDGYLV
jgi:hypothetical protein